MEAMNKIDKICADNGLAFRRKKPVAVDKGAKKCPSKGSCQEKPIVLPRRWETSDEEPAAPSQSQSGVTRDPCDGDISLKIVNRPTRSTYDSNNLGNSFHAVMERDRNCSQQIENISEYQSETLETDLNSTFQFNSPTARKQSENYGSNGISQALLLRRMQGSVKSKSQKRKPGPVERETLVEDDMFAQKQGGYLQLKNPKLVLQSSLTKTESDDQTETRSRDGGSFLTHLDELILKKISETKVGLTRRRSRFAFVPPAEHVTLPPSTDQGEGNLILRLLEPADEAWQSNGSDSYRSKLREFASQKLTFTKF